MLIEVLHLTERRLDFAVEHFDLLYSRRRFFRNRELRDFFLMAWQDVKPSFAKVEREIAEKWQELSAAGLSGAQMKFKMKALQAYDAEFARTWERYQTSSGVRTERGRRSRVSLIRKWMGRVLGQADTIIDSIAVIVPPADAIREFKETVERFSE